MGLEAVLVVGARAGTIQYALDTWFVVSFAHEAFTNASNTVGGWSGKMEMARAIQSVSTEVGRMHANPRSSTFDVSIMKPLEVVYIMVKPWAEADRLLSLMGCGLFAVIKAICSESPAVGVALKLNPYCTATTMP